MFKPFPFSFSSSFFFMSNKIFTKQNKLESGRLFVWGSNPCGQLMVGTCENIVTKPSCVKVIKKLGHAVKDFQYGSNFSVLLTGDL